MYIVLGIGYLILKALGKKNNPGSPPPEAWPTDYEDDTGYEGQRTPGQATQPASLEELLERFDEAKQRAQRRAQEKTEAIESPEPQASQQPMYRNLEQEAAQRIKHAEEQRQLQDILSAQERVKQQEREFYQQVKSGSKLGNIESRKSKFKRKSDSRSKYKNLLIKRGGLKQAVVMKEILDRKY